MLQRGMLISVIHSVETKEKTTALREASEAFFIRRHLVTLFLLPFVRTPLSCRLRSPLLSSPLPLIAKEDSTSCAPLATRTL